MRIILKELLALAVVGIGGSPTLAQEHPARRLSSIVGVAIEEYGKGIDERGQLTSQQEYQEAVDFLSDARQVAGRLAGDRADAARLVVDSLIAAVAAKRPVSDVAALHANFVAAIGAEGGLELPGRPPNLAAGRALYNANCSLCHGDGGLGDGPAAKGMDPPPPAIGSAEAMADATPALLYRVISVGIPGTQMPGWASTLTADQRWDVVAYLHSLRASPVELLEGEGLYLGRCATCHGPSGAGDGIASRALTRPPPEIGTLVWQAERSDLQIADVVRSGIAGTAMPPARDLSRADAAKIVAYMRSLPMRQTQVAEAAAADSGDPAHAPRRVLLMLDQALAAAQAGRADDAGDRAFDAYIAFEPLEAIARPRDPGLVASLEQHFADFRGALQAGDVRAAQQSRDAIEAGLPAIADRSGQPSGGWATFLQSLLIILREGFEAILVVGAVVTFLIKTGNRHRLRAIWAGVAAALAASAVTAVILQTVLRAMPATREIIEGITMLIAVAVLFSVSYWLISKVEAAKWQRFIREKVSTALEHGGGKALAFVAFLAVYREGAETALFYQALFVHGGTGGVALPITLGIVVGAVLLAIVFALFYRFGIRIPLRAFFAVTSVMLYYLAFVFMGKGIHELQEGDAVPITLLPGFPHVEALGIYPTLETVLGQLLLVALFVFALAKTFWPKRSDAPPTARPQATTVTDLATQLAQLQETTARLEARLELLERGVREEAGTRG